MRDLNYILILALSIIVITSCTKELKVLEESELPPLGTIIYTPETKIIDSTGCGLISIDSTLLVFTKNAVINTDSVKIGTILAAYPCEVAADGYLRKVVKIEEQNDKLVLTTEYASLEEMIEACNLSDTLELSWEVQDSLTKADDRSGTIKCNINAKFFNEKLIFSGESEHTVSVLYKMEKTSTGFLCAAIGLEVDGSSSFSVEYKTKDFGVFDGKKLLATYFSPPVPVAGPLYLRFEAPIYFVYKGAMAGSAKFTINNSANFNINKKYENSTFLPLEKGYSESTQTIIEAKGKAEVKFGISTELKCKGVEFVGVKIPVNLLGKISGELGIQNTPNRFLFKTCGGFEASAGIGFEAGFLSKYIYDASVTVPIYEKEYCKEMLNIETKAISNVKSDKANCSGSVSAFRSDWVENKGVCWSKSPDPTTAGRHKKNGSEAGDFEITMDSLESDTKYYVRAFCEMEGKTFYGNEVTFTTDIISSCGAYVAPNVWKEFQCYNLGAASTSADPFTPSWEINGGYWQWGRKNMAAPGPTASDPQAGAISGWNQNPVASGSWTDGAKTANDPCPTGFRVPTRAQWDAVRSNNALTNVGSWTESNTNYSSGKMIGNKLFLPAAGVRYYDNGALGNRGYYGNYWSSTEFDSDFAWYLGFDSSNVLTYSYGRTYGRSVRCVAE